MRVAEGTLNVWPKRQDIANRFNISVSKAQPGSYLREADFDQN